MERAVVFYISSHGFGHASRQIEVINTLTSGAPELRVIVRSRIPTWLVEASVHRPLVLQPADTDTGVVQIDSLTTDETETARRAWAFYQDFDRRVAAETEALEKLHASVVVGDVPPLASAAAHRAGVPSAIVANFTWDWIYRAYAPFDQLAPGVIDTIGAAYALTTRALRLPMHGGFETIRTVCDIPLIARRGRRRREDTRRLLALETGLPIVLASFGGYGLSLEYEEIARRNRITIVVTEHEAKPGESSRWLRRLDRKTLSERGIGYEDIVAASDVVVSKPGYGIVSECIANDAALLFTSRGHFAEYEVLTSAMPRVMRCRFLPQRDLREGRWSEHVEQLLAQARPPETLPTNGAEVATEEILRLANAR